MMHLLALLALLLVGCEFNATTAEGQALKMCADQHGTAVLENGHYVRCQFREGAK